MNKKWIVLNGRITKYGKFILRIDSFEIDDTGTENINDIVESEGYVLEDIQEGFRKSMGVYILESWMDME